MNKLVSVIIPVFNASLYIQKCITSLINQSYSNIEVICVDNNSTDNSLQILKQLQSQDNRVKIFSNAIKGASATRNKGLAEASGKYIVFVDSDDWVGVDYVKNLYEAIESNNVDMICSVINQVLSKEEIFTDEWSNYSLFGKYNIIYTADDLLNRFGLLYTGPVGKIFKKNIIDKYNLKFNENLIIGEDTVFNLTYMLVNTNSTFLLINNADYYYFQRSNSIIHNIDNKVFLSIFDQHKAIKNLLIIHNNLDKYINALNNHIIFEGGYFLSKTTSLKYYKNLIDEYKNMDNLVPFTERTLKIYRKLQKIEKNLTFYWLKNSILLHIKRVLKKCK